MVRFQPDSAPLFPILLSSLLLLGVPACNRSAPPGDQALPSDPVELYRLGTEALGRSETNRAVEYLQYAVERQPDFQEAQFQLARAAYAQSSYGLTVRALADALLLSPRYPAPSYSMSDLHYNLGMVYAQTQQPILALEQLRKAAGDDPKFGRAWLRVAEVELAQGDKDGARRDAGTALQADPGLADAHLFLGRLDMDAGDLSAAQRSFERAVSYDSDAAEPRLELAKLLVKMGHFAEALGPIQGVLDVHADHAEAWQVRAEALDRLGLEHLAGEARGHAKAA